MKAMNWDSVFNEGRDFRVMNLILLKQMLELAGTSAGRVLDLGCGTGDLAVKLAQKKFAVEAIDTSAVALGKAKERATSAGVSLRVHQANLDNQWPTFGQPFDLITCKLVLAFIDDKDNFLSQVGNVLAPSGQFLLISPVLHPGYEYSPRLQNISMQSDELNELLGRHFQNVKLIHDEYFEELGHEKYFLLKNYVRRTAV